MRKTARCIVLGAGLIVSLSVQAAPAGDLPLMPWPQRVERLSGEGYLPLSNEISIRVQGDRMPDTLDLWRERIARQTGWVLKPQSDEPQRPTINIIIEQKVDALPQPDSDESYRLSVTAEGVKLQAKTRFGAIRGMETLLQLIRADAQQVAIPFVSIEDAPRFSWRGLLLDSARHFIPVDDILRQIDGMAAAKLNVLHWHLTDDQGWRLASTHYPRLQHAASDEQFYTQAQMREVVRYAAQRGIRVVPEIDMPGHASAIAVAYPEIMSAPGPYSMAREWGVLKPVLDPTRQVTWEFVNVLIEEVTSIFPDPWIHIGGDEVDTTQWDTNPNIQAFMHQHKLKNGKALQAWFNQRLEKVLEKHQRRMMGWDEILNPSLPKTILIQSWQGQDTLGKIVGAGYQGILSAGFYVDQPQSTAYHYRNEVLPTTQPDTSPPGKAESAQSWHFTMPRLKGDPIEGSFTLIAGRNGQWRGFIDFQGKPRRAVRDIRWLDSRQVTFSVDTWMGDTRPVVSVKSSELSGYFLVGNTRYPVSGKKLSKVPAALKVAEPGKNSERQILGGEAALWSENVVAPLMDIKLWPRMFAVAERLWSAQDVNDVDNMYQRLDSVDAWSTYSVGLQQHMQSLGQMMRLAGSSEVLPLQIFSQALEPAQYYTRQHLKYRAGNYHQFEPLNRLADVLPAESLTVRQMDKWVDALIASPKEGQNAAELHHLFRRWQRNTEDVLSIIDGNYRLKALRPVAEDVEWLAELGIRLTELVAKQGKLSDTERQNWQKKLDDAALVRDEVVITAVYPLEKLLRASAR